MAKILIIEDDPVITISLEFLMKQNEHQVTLASNGEDGLQKAEQTLPDLILMDVMMPHRSGFELCQILRANRKFDSTRIVLLTAKGRDVDIQKGIALGADSYVTKPFSTRELVSKVKDLLAQERSVAPQDSKTRSTGQPAVARLN
jgi:DNA-binding response OmpR family regulator